MKTKTQPKAKPKFKWAPGMEVTMPGGKKGVIASLCKKSKTMAWAFEGTPTRPEGGLKVITLPDVKS